jgi:hypothetical protein
MKMRISIKSLSLILIAASALSFSCGGGGAETPKEKIQLGKLSKQWSIVSAKLGSETKTSEFNNFKLTISGTFSKNSPEGPYNYSVSGSRQEPSPWPASGTWQFNSIGSGDSGSIVRLDDDIAIEYVIQNNQLTITFNCPEGVCDYPGARAGSVQGDWEFVFN